MQGFKNAYEIKTIMDTYILLSKNLMVNTSQKSIIVIHTQKEKKESKHNTKDGHQITREDNKRRKEKRPTKTNLKQITK